jgi:hypothetical protein
MYRPTKPAADGRIRDEKHQLYIAPMKAIAKVSRIYPVTQVIQHSNDS